MKTLRILLIFLLAFSLLFSAEDTTPRDPLDFYVDVNVSGGDNSGDSWANAFSTIQEAIDVATVTDDIIWVAAGHYNEGTIDINVAIGLYAVDGADVTFIEGADGLRRVNMTKGTLRGFTITEGSSTSGGGVYFTTAGTVDRCVIKGNSADNGGAVYFDGGGTVNNSLLIDNTSTGDGGAVYFHSGGTMNNCTLYGNTASSSGGGAYLYNGGTLRNSILWGNTGTLGNNDIDDNGAANTISYNCASDGLTNAVDGCTTSDPLFIDAAGGNYKLYINSPCLNTGSNDYDYGSYDLEGNNRIQCTTVDMGAYEAEGFTFTDGSAYSNTATTGAPNQAFGRFQLSGSTTGGTLTYVSVRLDGIRTGLSNFRLWSSADANFDSEADIPLGDIVAVDPGNLGQVTFSGFTSSIATSGTYYFVSADVASNATGGIQGVIIQNNHLQFDPNPSSSPISTTISDATLSSTEVATPISLASFVAKEKNGIVELAWETASETENLAFRIYRDGEMIAELDGAGTTSEPQDYSYTDQYVIPGRTYTYVLADVDLQGKETKHPEAEVEVEVEAEGVTPDYNIGSAYPNPFNPQTIVPLNLATPADVRAFLYDLSGRMIRELYNAPLSAGSHDLKIDGSDLSTGIYLLQIRMNDAVHVQKIALMK